MDYSEFARQMRENAVKDSNGNIICSPELWERLARIIENIGIPKICIDKEAVNNGKTKKL